MAVTSSAARPVAAILSFAAALAALPAFAEEPGADPYALSPEQLFEATVISASRTPENLWDAPAAIYVITGEDISRAGVTSIPEALRLAPGVQVARVNTGGWAISMRGFNAQLANKLLVMIDGREVYDPLFSGVYWDVQDTALEDIDRIEIIRGPGASLWGANAVNGVINIITKDSAETQGALVSAIAGDIEHAGLTARYGARTGNATWRIYGRAFERAAFETQGGADTGDDWSALRGGFRMDAGAGGRDAFTLQGDVYSSEISQLRAIPQISAPYAVLVQENIETSGANLIGRWTRELGEGARFTLQSYIDYTTRDQIVLEDERTTFDIDAQYEFADMARHDIVAGLRYRHTSVDMELTDIIFAPVSSLREELLSAFVQDRITLVPERLSLTLGSKFDQNDFTGFEVQPNIRMQWHGGDVQTAWAAVSRSVRTPSELERELTVVAGVIPPGALPVPISVQPTASPDFESEELIAYEAGYRRNWTQAISTDISAFHNEYEGLATLSLATPELVLDPLHVILPIAYTNLTDAEANGFELALSWRAAETLNVTATYSYLDLELDGPPAAEAINAEAAEETSPRNLANLRVEWNPTSRWTADAVLYYVDSLPAFDLDAHIRLDARVGWRVTDAATLELVGQGLTDSSRVEFGGASDPNATAIPRSLYARLVWRH